MLEIILEPKFKGKVLTGRVKAHCGVLTWSFCTAEGGVAIVEAFVRERVWGWRETRPLCKQIEATFHKDAGKLAAWLNMFESTSCDVAVQPVHLVDQVGASLAISGSSLHDGVVATVGTAVCMLDNYLVRGVLRNGDCISATQQMLQAGMRDVISEKAFRTLTGGVSLSGFSEYGYRQMVGQL
ncbi:MAG: hypothetical protein NT034_01225 [Candidatus Magasanikbacteria bacterium]|nr:hypothetical protein [Candidatus Magasanikbacteria bacterium]